MKKKIAWCVIILMMTGISFGIVIEDFEDGDITSNPTWIVSPDVGDGMIVSDPIRPDNLVYKGYGTPTGHRNLWTNVSNGISWEGFDLTIEFMATQNYFSLGYGIKNDSYEMGVGLWLDNRSPGGTGNVVLAIEEYGSYHSDSWTLFPKSNFSYNQWYKVHSWYDNSSNLFMTDLRVLDTDQLIAQASRIPTVDYSIEADINSARFGIEEVDWQYADNVVLTPEPTTLALLGVGILPLLRKRKS